MQQKRRYSLQNAIRNAQTMDNSTNGNKGKEIISLNILFAKRLHYLCWSPAQGHCPVDSHTHGDYNGQSGVISPWKSTNICWAITPLTPTHTHTENPFRPSDFNCPTTILVFENISVSGVYYQMVTPKGIPMRPFDCHRANTQNRATVCDLSDAHKRQTNILASYLSSHLS